MDWPVIARAILTALDRAYLPGRSPKYRTIETLWDGDRNPAKCRNVVLHVLAGFGDKVIVEESHYPRARARLAQPLDHSHELLNSAGLDWYGGQYITSDHHIGDSRDDTRADGGPADALRQQLQSHAVSAAYLVRAYYDGDEPRPELADEAARMRDKYISQPNDPSRTQYARLLQTLADAGRLRGDAEIGYLPQTQGRPPADELEAAARKADELTDRVHALQVRIDEAEAEYDRLKAATEQVD